MATPRLPWKTKRLLRTMADFNRPARMRRYRRLNRPSLPSLTGCQWYDMPVVQKIWQDNRDRIDRRLARNI